MAGRWNTSADRITSSVRAARHSPFPSMRYGSREGLAGPATEGGGTEMSRKEKRGGVGEIGQSGYYARITKQRGGYLVEFPDLRGCLTEGKTIREALDHGREALSGWLFVAISKGDEIPPGRIRRARGYHLIVPDVDVAIPLAILSARKRRGLTQAQVADTLGMSQQAYRKFEMPGKSNPTLRSLRRLSEVLGLELSLRAA